MCAHRRRTGCRSNTQQEPHSKFAGSKTDSCFSTGPIQRCGRNWLSNLELNLKTGVQVDGRLRVLDQLELRKAVPEGLAELSYDNDQIRLLMTLPESEQPALALYAAPGIEALQRWSARRQLPGFESFDPTVCQSLHMDRSPRPVTLWLAGYLPAAGRWRSILVLGVFFRRIHKRKNFNIAGCHCTQTSHD